MERFRIIELPSCKMVSSGCSAEKDPFAPGGLLNRFGSWWSEVDRERKDRFFPRDFMWYDREKKGLVWYYAVSGDLAGTGGFEIVDYEGGLYASAVARDGDDLDGQNVYSAIKQWVKDGGCFQLDERPGHYDMFHIITSGSARAVLGYHQLEIFVPIRPCKV